MAQLLDMRTVLFVCGFVSLSLTLPMIYASLSRKSFPGFHIWTVGFILSGVGVILTGCRGLVPNFFTIVVANVLLMGHLSLISIGLMRFTGRRYRPVQEFLPIMAAAGLLGYFTWGSPDVNMRIVVLSVTLAVLYFRIGMCGVRELAEYFGSRNWLLALTCLVTSVWLLVRGALTLLTRHQLVDFMSAGTLHGLSVMVACVAGILIMSSLIIINSQRIENEMRAEEERYRLLFTQSPIGVVQIDRNGRIVEINAAFAWIIGATAQQLIGFDTLNGIENKGMTAAIQTALDGGTGRFEGAYTSASGGRSSFLQVLTQGIHAPDGTVTGGIGIFQDVSERKEAEKSRRNQERLQGVLELAGAVCHEMNQPLMVIQGCAELMDIELPSISSPVREKYSHHLKRSFQQIDRMKAITEKLMGITRYETKKYRDNEIFDIAKGVGTPG